MTNDTSKSPMTESACATNQKQDNAVSPSAQLPKAETLDIEIKKAWNKLTDEEVKLQATQPERFFAKVKEKYGTDKEEAQKRLAAIKAACGTCVTDKVA